jgi:hypothetical protein
VSDAHIPEGTLPTAGLQMLTVRGWLMRGWQWSGAWMGAEALWLMVMTACQQLRPPTTATEVLRGAAWPHPCTCGAKQVRGSGSGGPPHLGVADAAVPLGVLGVDGCGGCLPGGRQPLAPVAPGGEEVYHHCQRTQRSVSAVGTCRLILRAVEGHIEVSVGQSAAARAAGSRESAGAWGGAGRCCTGS